MNRSPLTGLRPSATSFDPTGEAPARVKPPPLRAILTRPVLISISSYGMLSLLTMAASALIPLVWSTSVAYGGLGLSPASIGLWMSWYGCMNGAVQYFFFPTPCLTLWSAEDHAYQRLNVRIDLRHVPIRELCAPSCLQRSKSGDAAHHATTNVICYCPDEI